MVELGCGVGACGILCARMASRVVMTDGEASTVDIARTNVRLAVEGGQLSEQQTAMGTTDHLVYRLLCAGMT